MRFERRNLLKAFNRGQKFEAEGFLEAAKKMYRRAGAPKAEKMVTTRQALRGIEDELASQLCRAIVAAEGGV